MAFANQAPGDAQRNEKGLDSQYQREVTQMLSNPHAGTDLETPWEQGFAAGFLAADRDLSPPSPLTPEAQEAYSEGVQAGRFSINGMRVPPTRPPDTVGTWESLLEFGAEHVTEHVLLEYAKRQAVKKLGAEVAS